MGNTMAPLAGLRIYSQFAARMHAFALGLRAYDPYPEQQVVNLHPSKGAGHIEQIRAPIPIRRVARV